MSAYFQLGFSGYGAMGEGQFDQPTTGKKEIVGMWTIIIMFPL